MQDDKSLSLNSEDGLSRIDHVVTEAQSRMTVSQRSDYLSPSKPAAPARFEGSIRGGCAERCAASGRMLSRPRPIHPALLNF